MDNRWHLDWTDQKSDWLGWVFHPFRPNCASSRLIENAQMAEQATPPHSAMVCFSHFFEMAACGDVLRSQPGNPIMILFYE